MANRVNLTLGVNADTSQAKKELLSLQSSIQNLATSLNTGNSLKGLTDDINNAKISAAQLSGELLKATNKNGGLDIAKLASQWRENGKSLEYYKNSLAALGPEGQRAFYQLSSAIYNAQAPMRELDGLIGKFAKGLANTAMWTIQSQAIHKFQSALSSAFNYAEKLNKGLTDIAIVSDLSGSKLTDFAKKANQMARELSASTSDVVSGALIYYQAGLNDEEVIKRTETTIKLAQTSGESAEQISSYMTAIWNNFYDGSKSVEYYADAISYLGAVTAASNADIAEGMQAFSAVAETVGLSFEYGAAALTTLRDITQQSASTIGNSLKTIFARLSSLKQGGELEDGVDLTKYSKALESVGVEVLDANHQLRDMDDILDDLASKWSLLSEAQKVALAQTVGGVRQYNNLISLMDNYERFQELVSGAKGSTGYLQKQADEYAESWEAAQKRVRAAWERMFNVLINDKAIIKIMDAFAKIINFVTAIVEKAGGLKTLLPLVVNLLSIGINDNLAKINARFKEIINNTINWKKNLKEAEQLRNNARSEVFGFTTTISDDENAPYQKSLFAAQDSYLKFINDINRAKNLGADESFIVALDLQAKHFLNSLQDVQSKIQEIKTNLNAGALGVYIGEDEGDIIRQTSKKQSFTEMAYSQFMGLGLKPGQQGEESRLKTWASNFTGAFDDEMQNDVALNSIFDDIHNSKGISRKLLDELKQKFEELIKARKEQIELEFKEALETNGLNKNPEELSPEEKEKLKELKQSYQQEFDNWRNAGQKQAEVSVQTQFFGLSQDEQSGGLNKEIDRLEKQQMSFGANAGYILGAVNGLTAMSNALGSVVDGIHKLKSENLEEALKQIGSGALSAATSFLTLVSTVDRSKLLTKAIEPIGGAVTGLFTKITKGTAEAASGAAAVVPGLLAITAAILAIVAIVKIATYVMNKETDELRKNCEQTIKNNEKKLELAETTDNLSKSVLELVESYEKLNKTGASTFDTIESLKQQLPDLISSYKELSKEMGGTLDPLIEKLQIAIDSQQWDKIDEIIEQINADILEGQAGASLENLNASRNLIATSEGASGKINNGKYKVNQLGGFSWQGVTSSDWYSLLEGNSGLDKYLHWDTNDIKTNGEGISLEDMPGYVDALAKAQNELAAAGQNNTPLYKKITKELEAMSAAVETYKETSKSAIAVLKQDFNQNGFDKEFYNNIPGMGSFLNNRESMIEALKKQYAGITEEEAEDILRSSESYGFGEKLYKKWLDAVMVHPTDENDATAVQVAKAQTRQNLQELADWYDNEVPEAYKQFALTMTIDADNLSKEALNYELMEAVETWRKGQFLQEAENRGLDLEELQDYADYLAEISTQSDDLADSMEVNADAAVLVARSIMSMNKGIEALSKGFDDWEDVLKNSTKESYEYFEAMNATKDAIADLFEISKEYISADFIADHLKEIEKAATGDEKAIEKLRDSLLDDIIIRVVTENNKNLKEGQSAIDLATIQDKVAEIRSWLDQNPIEVGTRLDMKDLTTDQQQFVDMMLDLISTAHMTADQANAIFDAIGFEATFATEPQPVTKVGYSTITSSRILEEQEFPLYQNGEKTGSIKLPAIETFTTAGSPYEYTDYVDAIAMDVHPEGEGGSTPKIESLTKKATPSYNNSSNSNKGGNGGHGGGGHHRTQKAKDEDRYHEINQQLKQTQHQLNKINTLKDRSYGRGRLAAMDQEIKMLEREAEQYKELYQEAEHWYSIDKAALIKFGATFNDDGTIDNYQAWQASWIDKYNNESISEEEFDAWKKAVDKYEDSLAHLNEAEEKYIETMNKIYDEHLEKIVYRVKYLNELIELSTDYLDYLIKKLDEDMYDTAETVAKMGEKASNILDQIANIQEGIIDALTDENNHPRMTKELIEGYLAGEKDLEEVLKNISQLTDKEQEQLRDWMKQLIDYNEELRQVQKEAYDKIIESVEEFNDKIQRQRDIVEETAGVMQHYANIIDIIGKDTLGISDAMMNALSDLQVTASQASLTIATSELEENKRILAEIQANLEEARERGTESDIKHFEEALEQQEDIVRNLAESWASAYEDALKAAQDAFTNGVKLATEAFDKAVSGSIGSLDKLQDFYSKQSDLKDLFLPDYQRIHDLSKLMRDVNNAINNTDNIKGKERLRNLQEDILKAQQEGTKLSEYDVEFMRKRLELEQAQIALEEARNAKNMVRMTRDNEGNWSYTYTQNPEEIEKAQQAYEDALYNAEKLQQERVKEVLKQMLSNITKFRDEIADSDMSDEEKKNALMEYWQEMINTNGDLLQTALDDGEWLTNTYDILSHNLVDSFEETLLALGSGYTTLDDFMNNFNDATAIMSEETAAQYQKWGDYIHLITEAAGIDFDNFAQRVADDMDLVIAAMIGEDGEGGAVGVAKQLADELGISIDDILEELRTWWDGPEGRSFQMEAEIAENEKIYEQLEKLIASADEIPIELPKISSAVQKISSGGNECGCGATCTTTCWTDCGSNGASQPRGCGCGTDACQGQCLKGCGGECSTYCIGNCVAYGPSGDPLAYVSWVQSGGGYATGGYTGSWGTSGKLAMLHEKELVLNADDTVNMLQTVGFVRDLVEMLTTNAGISASGLGNLFAGNVSNANSYLDQNVTIHAEFPNATNHSEIEEAFENLIGLASQYAGRKQ